MSESELMGYGGPFAKVIEASFDSLQAWMGQVPSEDRQEERAAFDRLRPLVLFFDVAEQR